MSPDNTIPEAIALRQAGAFISVVAVGDDMNQLELNGIASYPHTDNVMFANSFRGLPNLVSNAVKSSCNGKLIKILHITPIYP